MSREKLNYNNAKGFHEWYSRNYATGLRDYSAASKCAASWNAALEWQAATEAAEAACAKNPKFSTEDIEKMIQGRAAEIAAARQPAPVVAALSDLLEVYRSTVNSSYCQVEEDEELTARCDVILAAANRSQPEKQRQAHCPNCGAHGQHICPAGSQP